MPSLSAIRRSFANIFKNFYPARLKDTSFHHYHVMRILQPSSILSKNLLSLMASNVSSPQLSPISKIESSIDRIWKARSRFYPIWARKYCVERVSINSRSVPRVRIHDHRGRNSNGGVKYRREGGIHDIRAADVSPFKAVCVTRHVPRSASTFPHPDGKTIMRC